MEENWISKNFNLYHEKFFMKKEHAYVAYINGQLFRGKEKTIFNKKEKLFSALKRSTLFEVIKCSFYNKFEGPIKNKEIQSNRLTHLIFKELINKGIIIIKDIKYL